MSRLLSLLLLMLLAPACMIEVPVPEPEPTPLPPVPPGFPPPVDETPPALGSQVDQLWLVRVDRGLVNLAEPAQALIERFSASVKGAGLTPGTVVVASLYDGQLLWASGPGIASPGELKLKDVLQHHGSRFDGAAPTACSSSALGMLGRSLSSAELRYPPELGGGSSVRPFAQLGPALLVGVLDSGDPPRTASDAACQLQGESPAQWFGAHDPVVWLARPDGAPQARARTQFALVATGEGTSTDAYRQACLAQPGFPPAATDFVTAASRPFYGPWALGLGQHAGGLAQGFDLCTALGNNGAAQVSGFVGAWAAAMK